MKISSNAEVAAILGTPVTAALDIANDTATQVLCDLLGVPTLDRHLVTNEWAEVIEGTLYVNDFPLDIDEDIVFLDAVRSPILSSGFAYELAPGAIRSVRMTENGHHALLGYDNVFVSYTAGFVLQSKLTAISIVAMNGRTFSVTVEGVTTTYTMKTALTAPAVATEIAIGADVAECALNIATKLGGVLVGAEVTLPLGMNATLLTLASSQLTVLNSNIPSNLKTLVALLAGGIIAEQMKMGGVSSFKIDDKQVNFRDKSSAEQFQDLISLYLPGYAQAGFSPV